MNADDTTSKISFLLNFQLSGKAFFVFSHFLPLVISSTSLNLLKTAGISALYFYFIKP